MQFAQQWLNWQMITPPIASRYDLPVEWGAYVTGVQENGPAANAGLKEGDIITKFDETALDDSHSYINTLFTYNPGDTVVLTVMRKDQEIQLEITLDEL
jgi:serine protease Do